jgi:hypothetical protein
MFDHLKRFSLKGSRGATEIVLPLVIAGITGIGFAVNQSEVRNTMKLIERQQGRVDVQRKMTSALTMVESLIGAGHIKSVSTTDLVQFFANPDTPAASNTTGCSSVTGGGAATHDAGVWRLTAKTASIGPSIHLNLCQNHSSIESCREHAGETIRIEFQQRDSTVVDPDFELIKGRIIYTSSPKIATPLTATYNLNLQVKKSATSAPPPGPRCAIFIGTRGSHPTNSTASQIGKFPNWGNSSPHYNWWKMYIPHPPDIAAAANWKGTPGASRFKDLKLAGPTNTGHFAPCNRMYGHQWKCTAWYKPVPLTVNYCGQNLQTFTNHTPGSGTCGSDCRCYLGVQVSPLVVDFTGQGVEFSRSLHEQVKFDMGSGPDIYTPWIRNPESVGFIALDRNKNGSIDSVHELFGDKTKLDDGAERDNGFLALAHYDDNKDGKIDKNDRIYNSLLIWHDTNLDGISHQYEIKTFNESKILDVKLPHIREDLFKDHNGNRSMFTGSATLDSGNSVKVFDVYFNGAGSRSTTTESLIASKINIKDISFE